MTANYRMNKANSDSKPESIIIIGAGVAGLSAGCYANMNSYRTPSRSINESETVSLSKLVIA